MFPGKMRRTTAIGRRAGSRPKRNGKKRHEESTEENIPGERVRSDEGECRGQSQDLTLRPLSRRTESLRRIRYDRERLGVDGRLVPPLSRKQVSKQRVWKTAQGDPRQFLVDDRSFSPEVQKELVKHHSTVSFRLYAPPDSTISDVGFRCVRPG